jgi:hypothetical protein
MSHFSRIRTQMKEKDLIKKALQDMGMTCEEGEDLQVAGFGAGKTRVDIKIPLKLSTDIGLRLAGENYEIVADWYSVRGVNQKEFTQQINQRYAYHAARSKLETQGFNLVEEKVEETGQIRLVLRRMA